jgi:hypothetical protein
MRAALAEYLLEVRALLRDERRDRGTRPGPSLERDMEELARRRWLHAERRIRKGAYGGVYYSGLAPETDLFVYDGPEFLHIEAKDTGGGVGRAVPTEFWARALDLHVARAYDTLSESAKDHYAVLVVASDVSDAIRSACLRWGICLVEPSRVPIPSLEQSVGDLAECLRRVLCPREDFEWACLPLNRRYPRREAGILFDVGRLRTHSMIDRILRLQRIVSHSSPNASLTA